MGKVLTLTPPQLSGDTKKDMENMEKYLYSLTEQVDYQLYLLQKQKQTQTAAAET